MKNLLKVLPVVLFLTPSIVSAQLDGVRNLISAVGDLVQLLTVIIAAIALLVFFWGLVKFIAKAGDETAVAEGRRLMIWGVVALFVMVSVWGIIYFIANQIDPTISPGSQAPTIPTFPRP